LTTDASKETGEKAFGQDKFALKDLQTTTGNGGHNKNSQASTRDGEV
jgi:hypothetical protein